MLTTLIVISRMFVSKFRSSSVYDEDDVTRTGEDNHTSEVLIVNCSYSKKCLLVYCGKRAADSLTYM